MFWCIIQYLEWKCGHNYAYVCIKWAFGIFYLEVVKHYVSVHTEVSKGGSRTQLAHVYFQQHILWGQILLSGDWFICKSCWLNYFRKNNSKSYKIINAWHSCGCHCYCLWNLHLCRDRCPAIIPVSLKGWQCILRN